MTINTVKSVRRVLWVILVANLAVAALKVIVGAMINSASMTADGFHSVSDGSSNIVGLIGIRLASKPVDEDHPYGHKKFETLSALFISAMLFLIGGNIIIDGFSRIRNPVIPNITIESIIALVLTLIINIVVCTYEYRRGKELSSQILISDSMHTRSDIYVSLGVLITLIGIKAGLPPIIDPIMCFIVALFILHAAYEIFKENSGVLLDKAVLDTEKIREIIMSFEQVRDTHNIRSRGSGNDLYIDMHIMTDPDMSIEQSHELVHEIEEKLNREFKMNVQAIAHIEPYSDDGFDRD